MASDSIVPAALNPNTLNPNTMLAFLPPALADQYQATSYVVIATISVIMQL